jgi:hypothetical protein
MKLSPTRLVRKLAVITLAFWLAGAGCLLGCEGMATAAPAEDLNLTSNHSSTLIVEGDACASTEGHGCCKKKSRVAEKQLRVAASEIPHGAEQDLSSTKLNEPSTSGMKACPFAVARALSAAQVRDGKMSATAEFSSTLPGRVLREQKLILSATSPLPNRGHTYLHCCSFLI